MIKRYRSALARGLGRNIAHYRRRAHFTQEQLAEAIRVEAATVSRYETGATLPSLVTLADVASLLHVTMADLLAEEMPPPSGEGKTLLAMLEPLPPEGRRAVMAVMTVLVGVLRAREGGDGSSGTSA